MAKAVPPKTTDPARIRFVMMDVELPAGSDLGQIAHAIQNALRPPVVSVPAARTASAQQLNGPVSEAKSEAQEPEASDTVVGMGAEAIQEPRRSPRPARKTKGKTPNVLEVDLLSDTPFVAYAEQRNPTSRIKRYLVVAAWFKEHRDVNAITVDHVYTCYRAAKWPIDIPDFGQPLRQLKFDQLMDERDEGYAINHLGLQQVNDLNKA